MTGRSMLRYTALLLLLAQASSSPLRKRKNLVNVDKLFGGSDEPRVLADGMMMMEDEIMDIDYELRNLEGHLSLSFSFSMSMPSPRPPTGPTPPTDPAPTPRPPTGPTAPTPRPPSDGPSPTTPTPRPPSDGPEDCLVGTTKADFLEDALGDVPGFSTDPSTDEGQAFDWFVNTDTVDVCTYATLEQRYALAAFWFSTGGSDWSSGDGWTTSAPECEWQFVTCNGEGFVTALFISKCTFLIVSVTCFINT